MEHRITVGEQKTLVGQRERMSLLANTTAELWQRFTRRQKRQPFPAGPERYSVQVFAPGYFEAFRPDQTFEKWAAVEVTQPKEVPTDLETLTLPGGLYAVFLYRGPVGNAPGMFRYILTDWLPASPYVLDDRPHFEVLGNRYKNEDPASEEEIWIPIKPKQTAQTEPTLVS